MGVVDSTTSVSRVWLSISVLARAGGVGRLSTNVASQLFNGICIIDCQVIAVCFGLISGAQLMMMMICTGVGHNNLPIDRRLRELWQN
jgi:hypothetical protein